MCGDPEPAWHWYSARKNRKTVNTHIVTFLSSTHTFRQGTVFAFQLSHCFTNNIMSQPSQNTINTQSHFEPGDNRGPKDAPVDTEVTDMPGNEPWRAAAILLDAMRWNVVDPYGMQRGLRLLANFAPIVTDLPLAQKLEILQLTKELEGGQPGEDVRVRWQRTLRHLVDWYYQMASKAFLASHVLRYVTNLL